MSAYTDYVDKVQAEYSNPSQGELIVDRYNIQYTQYPSDLGEPDLKHFVLFNINVRGKSKLDESKRLFEVKRDPDSANLSREQLGADSIRNVTAAAAGVAAGVAVTALADTAARAFGKTGSTAKVVTKVVGTGAGVAVAGATLASDLLKPDTMHRISDAIALHLDGPPTVKYNMNYANKDLGTLLGALGGGLFDSKGAVTGGEAAAALGATLAKLPGAFGAADVQSAMSSAAGVSLNPFKETVFESVDFRSFGFKYKFFPKNKRETDAVFSIIKTFKEHMHPQLSEGKLFFIYPSEFQITYYYGAGENTYFHKFRPCALESLEVTYGSDQFTSFKDGAPTEINLSMTFRELEILTRNMIKDNY